MDHTLHNIAVYNRCVASYSKKFMDLNLYKDSFAYLLQTLPAGAYVLELGCGPGNVVHYLSTKRPDLQFLGIDLSPEMIKKAQEHNPKAAFRVMDIRQAGRLTERFDAVLAPFCLPYLPYTDLPGVVAILHQLTRDGGFIYLSCMEGPPSRSGFEKTSFTADSELFITYYERGVLEALLKENGFTLQRFYTIDYPEPDGSTTTELVYVAQRN